MSPSGNTGASGPAWIAERIREREEVWPTATLCAGLSAVLLAGLAAGVWIWTSDAWLVYALP